MERSGSDSLITRFLKQLQKAELCEGQDILSLRDEAELRARLKRLRRMGGQFRQVRLSHFVAENSAAEIPCRIGG